MSPPAKALLTVAVGMLAISPAAADKPELLLKNVGNWWVVDGGKTLVAQVRAKVRRIDPGTKDAKTLISIENTVRRVFTLGGGAFACEAAGEYLTTASTVTGRGTVTALQAAKFEVFGRKPGRPWCVLMSDPERSDDPIAFHRLDLESHKTSPLLRLDDGRHVVRAGVTPDGKRLIVWTESDAPGTLLKRIVQVATGKVETEHVSKGQALYPLPDGTGHVVRRKDKLYVVRGGKERELFEGKYRASARPDVPLSPRRLAVMRLTDTNKDGKISKEDGDLPEIWVLDLATLKKKRIADAKQQNIMRGWSADGECLAFKRWEPPELDSRRLVSALVIYDATTGQPHYSFPAKGGLSVRFVAFLPGGWALTRDINLLSKTPSKELPFLFGFRHEDRRIAIPEPKKKVAVVGKWLVMSDHDKSAKPRDLFRWKLPEE